MTAKVGWAVAWAVLEGRNEQGVVVKDLCSWKAGGWPTNEGIQLVMQAHSLGQLVPMPLEVVVTLPVPTHAAGRLPHRPESPATISELRLSMPVGHLQAKG